MIAKNDEAKRSKIWRIVMAGSTILIIVGAAAYEVIYDESIRRRLGG